MDPGRNTTQCLGACGCPWRDSVLQPCRNITASLVALYPHRFPFLQLLLQRVSERAQAGVHSPHLMHLEQVLVDELELATPALSQLSLPADTRAKQVAQLVLAGSGDVLSQPDLAKQAGLSVRTLSRLFMQQTGLTFSQWKQKARVLRSLEYLQRGTPVSQAALLVGYENVSAFIMVFRRFMGMTPGQFQSVVRC
ncbi:AraC family transcriptional regulator [Mangrovibacter sp. SLW1]